MDETVNRPICHLGSLQERLLNYGALWGVARLVMIGLMLLVSTEQMVAAEELNPDKFRKMVQTELERTQVKTDSVGTSESDGIWGSYTGLHVGSGNSQW
jgi:hypothetical protein